MATAHYQKHARKDYPEFGIKKGQPYWWWRFYMGPRIMSAVKPKRSQLTRSWYLQRIYDCDDQILELDADQLDMADLIDDIEEIHDRLEAAYDLCEGKLEACPKEFRDTQTGAQILKNRMTLLKPILHRLKALMLAAKKPTTSIDSVIDALLSLELPK